MAVLYNGELEWMGKSMFIQKPLRKLYENQIVADTIPLDVFFETERYHTRFEDKLIVNNQEYELLIVPYTQFINKDIKEALDKWNTTDFEATRYGGVTSVFYNGLTLGQFSGGCRFICPWHG